MVNARQCIEAKVTCARSMYHLKSEIFKHSGLRRRRLIAQ
jgi:hypothetical protein